jgi:ParB/RepB/Spo0J family partition protein
MKNFELKTIAINKLAAHPGNPNVMSKDKFRKLIRNIERTGYIEPIVVRPHPNKKGKYQIINGHHRVKALEKLGQKQADCVIWDVDNEQTDLLLATLNRLTGVDAVTKKIALLTKLKERLPSIELAKLLPQTRGQIEQLTNLKLKNISVKINAEREVIPMVFFVKPEQNKIIEEALNKIPQLPGLTKTQNRAAAITEIATQFLRNSLCQTQND